MSPSEMKAGRFYKQPLSGVAEYIGRLDFESFVMRDVKNGNLFRAFSENYTECDRDGNPIAPEPMAGDYFENNFGNRNRYVLLKHPTAEAYCSVATNGLSLWNGWRDTPAEAVQGLAFVRRAVE